MYLGFSFWEFGMVAFVGFIAHPPLCLCSRRPWRKGAKRGGQAVALGGDFFCPRRVRQWGRSGQAAGGSNGGFLLYPEPTTGASTGMPSWPLSPLSLLFLSFFLICVFRGSVRGQQEFVWHAFLGISVWGCHAIAVACRSGHSFPSVQSLSMEPPTRSIAMPVSMIGIPSSGVWVLLVYLFSSLESPRLHNFFSLQSSQFFSLQSSCTMFTQHVDARQEHGWIDINLKLFVGGCL